MNDKQHINEIKMQPNIIHDVYSCTIHYVTWTLLKKKKKEH